MTKKLLCFLLAFCLFALCAAGCGNNKAGAPESTDPAQAESTDAAPTESEAEQQSFAPGEVTEGAPAPDFTATLTTGETFTLSDHKDEVVLLNFWATWCQPCVREMPEFQKIADEGIENFTLIAVNCSEWKDTVDAFLQENGFTFNVAYDENGEIGSLYPTDGIPYTLVINKGVIANIFLGVPLTPYETYKGAVEACFAQ